MCVHAQPVCTVRGLARVVCVCVCWCMARVSACAVYVGGVHGWVQWEQAE